MKKRISCLTGKKVKRTQHAPDGLDQGIAAIAVVKHPFTDNLRHHRHPVHVNNRPTQPVCPIKMMKIHQKTSVAHQLRKARKIREKFPHPDNAHVIDLWKNRKVDIRARKIIPKAHQRSVNPRNAKVTPNRLRQMFNQNRPIILMERSETIALVLGRVHAHIQVHVRVHDPKAIKIAVQAVPDQGNIKISRTIKDVTHILQIFSLFFIEFFKK